jgi:hypothetical protein
MISQQIELRVVGNEFRSWIVNSFLAIWAASIRALQASIPVTCTHVSAFQRELKAALTIAFLSNHVVNLCGEIGLRCIRIMRNSIETRDQCDYLTLSDARKKKVERLGSLTFLQLARYDPADMISSIFLFSFSHSITGICFVPCCSGWIALVVSYFCWFATQFSHLSNFKQT